MYESHTDKSAHVGRAFGGRMNSVRVAGLRRSLLIGCWPLLGAVLGLSAGCGAADENPSTTDDQATVTGGPGAMLGSGGASGFAMAGTGAPPLTGSGGSGIQMMGSGGTGSVAVGPIH